MENPRRTRAGHRSALLVPLAVAGLLALALWLVPLFRIVPLHAPARAAANGSGAATPAAATAFDPVAAAAKLWQTDLPAAATRALELKTLAPALRENAESAKTKFAKSAGLGAAYYFVRGSGQVVARDRNYLRVALDSAGTGANPGANPGANRSPDIIALRIGPVFGNTVRDGCGLLDVNAFPGLQEFNALSAALNALVEQSVLPALREAAVVGATLHFAGCAEAAESAPASGEPLLTLVPVSFTAPR